MRHGAGIGIGRFRWRKGNESYGTRAELARMLGVSLQLISDWFAGREKPTLDSGLKIQVQFEKAGLDGSARYMRRE